MINITYEGEALHETCWDLQKAELAYGSISAGALVTLISEAESLETADEMLDLLGDDAKILPDDSLSVAISSDYRIVFIVVGTHHSLDANGRIAWASVTRLKLLTISRVP